MAEAGGDSPGATPGTLHVVATPIGNLGDISARAAATLRQAALILAEDTRRTGVLLRALGIATPLRAFHEHNERRETAAVIARLRGGADLALVADAGTPLISDPGGFLLRRLHEERLPVSVAPGPCALTAALSVSGLAVSGAAGPGFVFNGFLPPRAAARLRALRELRGERRALVFYEAPRRVAAFLAAAIEVFGGRREALLCRELTKKFEQIRQATLAELADWLAADDDRRRGEFVIVIAGAPKAAPDEAELARVLALLPRSLSLREAARLAAEITGGGKNDAYRLALDMRGE